MRRGAEGADGRRSAGSPLTRGYRRWACCPRRHGCDLRSERPDELLDVDLFRHHADLGAEIGVTSADRSSCFGVMSLTMV